MTDAATTTWPPDAAVTAPGLPRLLPPAALDLAGHVGSTARCATPALRAG